ncbi:Peroxiredoxin [Catalinimonas alkaloidigena]|uniref:Peroxiredoxin n=1 Tax=Catalinimonas alkaloidigena TaxID=1075417 RepID=A0A1G9AC32_9BACT|nr:redoxin domain-containing protein [Catalinimonas alkaloidigena]SDK24793.1 Peroxiredoxin [Catalinimonas alkaloidigena]
MKHVVFPLVLVLALASCSAKKEKETTPPPAPATPSAAPAPAAPQNDLPPIPVSLTDGSTQQINGLSGKTVLVLFQPDCDHCQREARQIHENLGRFYDYQVYFISSAPLAEVRQFAVDYQFADVPNFHFGTTSVVNVLQQFGSIPTPSIYVYSDEGKLVQKFEGETPIDQILPTL